MGLRDVLADGGSAYSGQFFQPEAGAKTPGSNIIALALVAAGALPALGASYTPPGGTAGTLTPQTLVGYIKTLAFLGKAVFFGNGMISGKLGAPDEFKEGAKYGTRVTERPTGDVAENLSIEITKAFLNVPFFNSLRANAVAYDVYIFTENSVQIAYYDLNQVQFEKVTGYNITSDITKEIAGSFDVRWTSTGQLVPAFGVLEAALSADGMHYSFGAYGTATGITQVGTEDRFTATGSTAGSFTRAVVEGGQVSYQIFRDSKTPITTEGVTINTVSGKVDIAGTLPSGRFTFTVVASNTSGVWGKYQFVVEKA